MAQFRTTADIINLALTNGGEVINGTSPYLTQLLNYLNRVHYTLVAGGTIPVGNDSSITIDEVWPWSKAHSPMILELEPKYTTGTVSLTIGSEVGTFSAAPTSSLQGWYLRVVGKDEFLRIDQHAANSTNFEINGAYPDATGTGLTYEAYKLDYELVPSFITIDSSNNQIQFQEAAGVTQTGVLTAGVYAPADLCTEIATQLTAGTGSATYTVTYSTVTRFFTLASDRAGGATFVLVCTGTQSAFSCHKLLGFDDVDTTNAASITSTYVHGGICRLVEPIKRHKGINNEGSIYGIDAESFQRDYPFSLIEEGQPDRFAVVRELPNGTFTIRINRYPMEKTRIEVEYVPVPRDLQNNSSSIPRVPRKHIDVLEDAASFYLLLSKNDDRAQTYATLMQGILKAMKAQHQGSIMRSAKSFGQIVSRPDMIRQGKRRLIYGDKN